MLTLQAICELPAIFRKRPGIPLSALLPFHSPAAGTVTPAVGELEAYLAQRQELIEGWLDYSADKWPLEGWYFRIETGPLYHVFHRPMSGGRSHVFPTAARACADFIVRELGESLVAT